MLVDSGIPVIFDATAHRRAGAISRGRAVELC
jgi:hypothetical protein